MYEQLNHMFVETGKLVKATEKVRDVAERVPEADRTKRYEAVLAEMCQEIEVVDTAHMELGFALKYKKTQGGERLTVPTARNLRSSMAGKMQELVQLSKAMRALLPKAKAKEVS